MDIHGNWATATGTFTIVDSSTPTLVAVSAAPDPVEIYNVVNVSGGASDPFLANVSVEIMDPLGNLWVSPGIGWDLPSQRYYTLYFGAALGSHTYLFRAEDSTGNNATATGSFLVRDTIPPQVVAAADPPVPANGSVVRLLAAVSDNHVIASVTVSVTDPLGAALGTFPMTFDPANDTWYHDVTATVLGIYDWVVTATDQAGNAISEPGSFTSADREPPSIDDFFLEPALAELGNTTYIAVVVSDNVGIDTVRFEVRDVGGALVGNFTANRNPANGRWELTQAFASGPHDLRIWVADTAGNLVSATSAFAVGSGAGPVAEAGPDVTVDLGSPATVDGGASWDDVGIVRWEWSVTGPAGPYIATTPAFSVTPDRPGTYTATLRVWDAAGRSATDTATIVVQDTGTGGPLGVDWWWIILLLLLLLIVIFLVMFVVWRRRKEKARLAELRQEQAAREAEARVPPPPPADEIPPPPPDA
jgi:hypothetical protein